MFLKNYRENKNVYMCVGVGELNIQNHMSFFSLKFRIIIYNNNTFGDLLILKWCCQIPSNNR